MQPSHIEPKGEFLGRAQLTNILIAPDSALEDTTLFTDGQGKPSFLPRYRLATQGEGGQTSFASSLTNEGKLTLFLQSYSPSEFASRNQGATPLANGTGASLEYDEGGQPKVLPLRISEGRDGIRETSVTLDPVSLTVLRPILFDTVPRATLVIKRQIEVAVQMTSGFIKTWWQAPSVRNKLLSRLPLIEFDDPDSFEQMVTRAYPDFTSQFIVLVCTYDDRIPVPTLPGYLLKRITWNGRIDNYYQDNQQIQRVHYLPDGFKLALGPSGTATASLLQFKTPDGSIEQMNATFRFYAEPVVELPRIEDARKQLQVQIGQSPEMLSVQDARGLSTQLTLTIPTANGKASKPQLMTQARVSLTEGIVCELNLNFDEFRALWDAIFSKAPEQPILAGWIDVTLEDGNKRDRIDVKLRLPPGEKEEQDYFYKIYDSSSFNIYSRQVTIRTFKPVFDDSGNADPILLVGLDFGGSATVEFTCDEAKESSKTLMEKQVKLQRAVSDIILKREDPAEFAYRLKVSRFSGDRCSSQKTKTLPISVFKPQIEGCTQPCG